MSLNNLKIGEEGIITTMEADKTIKRRLMDIGFVKGSKVKVLLINPTGDMVAYSIKGTVIALRKEDTKGIKVDKL